MRRRLTMNIGLDINDKDRYEQIRGECERFKDALMYKMEDYDFRGYEHINISLQTMKDGGDK